MSTRILALFPGQGSQKVGMGKDHFDSSPVAQEYFARANEALGFSLSEICFQGPAEKLTATEIAQPAILTTSIIAYALARESNTPAFHPVAAAGHSLGEYSALVAAQAISFDSAVKLVHQRGRYMQSAVPAGAGKMVAVLGREIAEIEAALQTVKSGVAEIANINAPGQIVVAGARAAVDEFVTILSGARVMELQVSAPFHCSLMQPAADALAKDLDQIEIRPAKFPIVSNFSAQPVTQPDEIRDALKRQVCGRVRWVESIEHAVTMQPEFFLEFGAGTVLTGLMKRIHPTLKKLE